MASDFKDRMGETIEAGQITETPVSGKMYRMEPLPVLLRDAEDLLNRMQKEGYYLHSSNADFYLGGFRDQPFLVFIRGESQETMLNRVLENYLPSEEQYREIVRQEIAKPSRRRFPYIKREGIKRDDGQ